MDGTPIYDIKPYVAYADSHEGVRSGFVDSTPIKRLKVAIPEEMVRLLGASRAEMLRKTLELDPRPHYQHDSSRVYGMPFDGHDIHFIVDGDTLTVIDC